MVSSLILGHIVHTKCQGNIQNFAFTKLIKFQHDYFRIVFLIFFLITCYIWCIVISRSSCGCGTFFDDTYGECLSEYMGQFQLVNTRCCQSAHVAFHHWLMISLSLYKQPHLYWKSVVRDDYICHFTHEKISHYIIILRKRIWKVDILSNPVLFTWRVRLINISMICMCSQAFCKKLWI